MGDYLVFHLAAAMGAMGEFAGHERRGSLTWPARSALIGLLGAALGLRRDKDFSELEALRLSVAVFEAGEVLRDYHTVQTVPSAAAKAPQSRPAALRMAGRRTNTTITLRDYRTGPLYGVAVEGEGLEALATALHSPAFPLYLGRKSCPLAAPVGAQVVQAQSAEGALAQLRLPRWHAGAVAGIMACDSHDQAVRSEQHYDVATDRRAWHFAPRDVAIVPVEIAPKTAEAIQ